MIGDIDILLESRYSSETLSELPKGWDDPERLHPQMYLKKVGRGEVLYPVLEHCCGRFDMQPIMEECDIVKGSWDLPVYYELLRRGISWGITESSRQITERR